MLHRVVTLIDTLFHTEKPSGKTLTFNWRLVTRHGRPLLLMPEDSMEPEIALGLYSAQRRRAKIWRAMLPKLFRSPARIFFKRVTFKVDVESSFIKFLAEQSGVPVEDLRAPAIKIGGVGEQKIRVALMACDTTNRPAKVIKAGLNPAGRVSTEREADMLAQLPKQVIGCIRMSGRMATEKLSAFATPFFPGDSPVNDAGLEILFHSWLKEGELMAVEDFESWDELESLIPAASAEKFRAVRSALAGKQFRSTLYHGDFTPWNLRVVNQLNLRAYDWEGGYLRGIPGWDWFHFFVQTSILVKRHSPERVAAELDQLLQSPRFQKYAQAAGIEHLLEPLLLAYLLHQKHVVQPLEGGEVADQLLGYLWTHWRGKLPVAAAKKNLGVANAWAQIRFAVGNLANLFWQPTLSHAVRPGFAAQCERHWKALLASLVWIVVLVQIPLHANPHMTFAPFYMVPVIYFSLRADRRLATFVALVAAFGAPLMFYYGNPLFAPLSTTLWNGLMRLVIFQSIVVIFDRVRRQNVLRPKDNLHGGQNPLRAIYGNWAVVLFALIFLLLVIVADYLTGANVLMMGLYILPCMMMTLAMGSRWGTLFAVVCAVLGPLLQREDASYRPLEIELWNTAMRFVMYEVVVLMIERVRRENILFNRTPPPDDSGPGRPVQLFA
jgi:hypothetical protein